jgi:hypothetical protein
MDGTPVRRRTPIRGRMKMRAYYIVPSRRKILQVECLTLRQVCDMVHAPRQTHIHLANLFRNDEAIDVLFTNAFPPFDHGKFVLDGHRYVGCGVIIAHPHNELPGFDGVMDMAVMMSSITALECYVSKITF